jgi:hypothetical protein
MAWYLVKHRDDFTFTVMEMRIQVVVLWVVTPCNLPHHHMAKRSSYVTVRYVYEA